MSSEKSAGQKLFDEGVISADCIERCSDPGPDGPPGTRRSRNCFIGCIKKAKEKSDAKAALEANPALMRDLESLRCILDRLAVMYTERGTEVVAALLETAVDEDLIHWQFAVDLCGEAQRRRLEMLAAGLIKKTNLL